MTISPSSLNLYFQCPYRWYLSKQKIDGIWVDDRHARFGSMIHNIIANYFKKLPSRVNESTIENLANKCLEDYFDDSLSYMRKTANTIISNFISFEKYRLKKWKTYRPKFIEQRIRLGDYLVGVIDFYGNDTIIDWKTGSYSFLTLDLKRQGGIYKYLVEKSGHKVNNVIFVFLRENKIVELPEVTKGWVESEVNKMIRSIEAGIFTKKKSHACSWCEYKLRCQFEEERVCLWSI